MEFDVVVGNPPYNKDIYLDFVQLGYRLSNKYTCMITPAKWQAKGGEKNEQFRKEIVPHISKIVYYPDCLDIFAIADACGISYYLIDKNNKYNNITVENKCNIKDIINSTETRSILNQESLWNIGDTIVKRIGNQKRYYINKVGIDKKYVININTQSSVMRGFSIKIQDKHGKWIINPDLVGVGGAIFDQDKKIVVLGKISLIQDGLDTSSGTSANIFESDNIDECKSFVSWILTKFVQFLVLIGMSGLTIINNETWRFVPDPGAFDHIFTDEELYAKYGLTDEEINIIESVIKEWK